MIVPTVGRQVWYRPHQGEMNYTHTQPFAATVLHVWGDNCVNVEVKTETGMTLFKSSCTLAQDRPANPGECEWMPYQTGQAKKVD